MAIIGKVGQKSVKVKILVYSIHIVLLLGSITMVYPFMIMLSASFSSGVDSNKFSVIPKFFNNTEIQFKKYIEARYNDESHLLAKQTASKYVSFDFVKKPQIISKQMYLDWQTFLKQSANKHSVYDYYISEQYGRQIYPRNERAFKNLLKKEFKNDINLYNKTFSAKALSWDEIKFEKKNILTRNFNKGNSKILKKYNKFVKKLPLWHRAYASIDAYFVFTILQPKFKNDLNLLNLSLNTNYNSWNQITLPKSIPNNKLKPYWIEFVKKIINISHINLSKNSLQNWQNFLQKKYANIKLLNTTYKTNYNSFLDVNFANINSPSAMYVDWTFFIENVAKPKNIKVNSVELDFKNWLKNKYKTINNLQKSWYNNFNDFEDVPLFNTLPLNNLIQKQDWIQFYKKKCCLKKIELKPQAQADFISFINAIFIKKNGEIDLQQINKKWQTNFKNIDDVYPALTVPKNYSYRNDWKTFVRNFVNPKFVKINCTAKLLWIDFLKQKYTSFDNYKNIFFNKKSNFKEISIDWINIDWHIFKNNKSKIIKEFLVRNYVMVLDVLLYNGKAIFNTLIYVVLAIVFSLLINPFAAYALSRFKLKSTYKVLLLLMLTMAFPPMVMGIPNFLLLKNLNLLNTFWALVLPAAADGYFIFLLKGFFDSLPKELFENAMLEGASELTLFFKIAMPLSKPIMAVIALGAFNAAYRNFMFAFIVCQDKNMWTLMVHLYQLMQRSTAGVGYAALVIAAIPTFAVFVFFQNIIIKGIVVPTEK